MSKPYVKMKKDRSKRFDEYANMNDVFNAQYLFLRRNRLDEAASGYVADVVQRIRQYGANNLLMSEKQSQWLNQLRYRIHNAD